MPSGQVSQEQIDRLNQQVMGLFEQGRYRQALELATQVCEWARRGLGENHPLRATGLHNLGFMCQAMGEYARAEPLYRQALEIRKRLFGENHPACAATLGNLAGVYEFTGDYAAAEPLYRRAVDILRRAPGGNHSDYAASLNNLAGLHYAKGEYARAEPLYRQALAIWQEVLGEDHPDYAAGLYHLAVSSAAQGRAVEALDLMRKALAIDEHSLGQIFTIGSDRQRLAYLQKIQTHLQVFLSLVCRHLADSRQAIQAALEVVLRRKALAAEALMTQRDAILGGRNPLLQEQLRKLTLLRRQIARQTLAGPAAGEDAAAHLRQLAQWHAERERQEQALARQVPEMDLEQKLRAAGRRAVALAVPAGVALVEFVRFHVVNFQAVPARDESQWQPARYLAFVLSAAEPDDVQMLDLGEAEPIDRMIADFRAGITRDPDNRRAQVPYADEEPGADGEAPSVAVTGQGTALRQRVFDVLLPHLGGRTRLLLCPDGDLTRLPFEVLPDGRGGRLIDTYRISYLSSGRDVLRCGTQPTGQPRPPLVVADPDFDLVRQPVAAASSPAPPVAKATATKKGGFLSWLLGRQGGTSERGTTPRRTDCQPVLRKGSSAEGAPSTPRVTTSRYSRDLNRAAGACRLPGTRIEGERIAALLNVQPWLETHVLEACLKGVRSPRLLHLATHGFFLRDQPRQDGQAGGAADGLPSSYENPLLRSGLLLAGYNTWLARGELPPEAEDGMLTAEDVTGLDLLDTELVVLSACETGLGQVHVGEGVFGLRRAFVLAGAKTLVMSLWKVPDLQTQELMVDFYQRILAGQPRAEALRQAQLALKARHPDPYYWGAFICQGDPGPMAQMPAGPGAGG
jgi:tetratricopeptide (TPR) repeat protein